MDKIKPEPIEELKEIPSPPYQIFFQDIEDKDIVDLRMEALIKQGNNTWLGITQDYDLFKKAQESKKLAGLTWLEIPESENLLLTTFKRFGRMQTVNNATYGLMPKGGMVNVISSQPPIQFFGVEPPV